MRYSQQDKREYLEVCRLYNQAAANWEADKRAFIVASVVLHSRKGRVPQSMRTAAFVASVGV